MPLARSVLAAMMGVVMFRQLKPVSDLQRAQRFDDYDLVANRTGNLSSRQRWRFMGAQLAEYLLGALTAVFSLALLANMFQYAPSPEVIGLVVAGVLIAAVILFVIRVRAALIAGVESTSGLLAKHEVIPLDGLPLEEIAVGQTLFYVRPEVYDVLDEETTYRVYYLARSPRSGGNLILSIEGVSSDQHNSL
jgi:hypothetical protein